MNHRRMFCSILMDSTATLVYISVVVIGVSCRMDSLLIILLYSVRSIERKPEFCHLMRLFSTPKMESTSSMPVPRSAMHSTLLRVSIQSRISNIVFCNNERKTTLTLLTPTDLFGLRHSSSRQTQIYIHLEKNLTPISQCCRDCSVL